MVASLGMEPAASAARNRHGMEPAASAANSCHALLSLLCLSFFLFLSLPAFAQSNKGTITPVDSDDEAPQKPVLHYYDKHGEKLETPVLFLAELDTVKANRPSSPYPLINGYAFGVNFGDAILSLIGQKHYSFDVSAMMSLHNWFFPVIEAGIGWGHHTETGDLYKVKAKPSFYGKVGLNYNFLYKSKPDYMAFLGLRFGFTHHTWDVTDIKPTATTPGTDTSGDITDTETAAKRSVVTDPNATQLLNQSCMSIYGEILAGMKVKIVGPFSLGWNIRYRLGLHSSKKMDPWFVPGYGTGPLGVTVHAYLTFGEKPRRDAIALPEELPIPDSPSTNESTDAPTNPDSANSPI